MEDSIKYHRNLHTAYISFTQRYIHSQLSTARLSGNGSTIRGYVINDGALLFDFDASNASARVTSQLNLLKKQSDVIRRYGKQVVLQVRSDLRKNGGHTVTSHANALRTVAMQRSVDVITVSEVCDSTCFIFCLFIFYL